MGKTLTVHQRIMRAANDLEQAVLNDPIACAAARENDIRRRIGQAIEQARRKKGFSVRKLAKEIGTSLSQVQRLRHHEYGGSLTLWTIVRACMALDLDFEVLVGYYGPARLLLLKDILRWKQDVDKAKP